MKVWMPKDGIMCECEATFENGEMMVHSCVPITPQKEYDDFMAQDSKIKEIMFNDFLSNYCIAGNELPYFIKRICKENGIKYRRLRKEFIEHRKLTKFKIFK